MNSLYNVIIRPIISERSYDLMEQGKYTLNVRGKEKRVRYQSGMTRSWKKAVVTLAEGEQIEIFATQQAPAEQ